MARKFIDIRVTALSDEDLVDFYKLLSKIQYCGDIGANRKIPIQVDGDGSGQYSFELHTKEIGETDLKNIDEIIEVSAEEKKTIEEGNEFPTQYLGE